MKLEKCIKESFAVIGKEGSTNDGVGFIEKLWENANSNFNDKRVQFPAACGVRNIYEEGGTI